MKRLVAGVVVVIMLVVGHVSQLLAATETPTTPLVCNETTLYCPAISVGGLADTLKEVSKPAVVGPNSSFATAQCGNAKAITRTVKYQIASKGTITADLQDFATKVQETYDNDCGWERLGVKFEKVVSGGSYTVILSQASLVPTYGSICDSTYSCRVGNNVVINQDRWLGGTPAWNNAGGDLRNYRHMVVNHETGHWLGHGHENCVTNSGNAAPVMQQQSISLKGCKFNPWPLNSEIWSTTLGI